MIAVSDTSPLTNLASIRRLTLLGDLFQQVLIPEAVAHELVALDPSHRGFVLVSGIPWISVRQVENQERVESLLVDLDPGEAEAIVLANEVKADALIIDERMGTSIARSEGIEVTGLIGILIRAKEEGLIPQVRPILDELIQDAGFWISDAVYAFALERAGEKTP
ncbi:MAG: DUF3368 domain-containing protein [Candidatus Poribacteria bacterium]|nr:DUF3368 domain-containing protein [Candidatus Poribacteria bacterium]